MSNRKMIKLSYPIELPNSVKVYLDKLPHDSDTIYYAVDFFEKNIFSDKIKLEIKQTGRRIPLRTITNLHNKDGIKDIQQIKNMIRQVKSKKDILHPTNLPNIKLVRTKRKELVLFDGHHSMLAYMAAGRSYLDELPHLIIEGEDGYVLDREILVFFGAHSEKVKYWRKYVINWQNPIEKQLCRRIQKNMGELLKSIMAYL